MTHTREDLTFTSGGDQIAAWLYRPSASAPVPCVVMAHGFSATRRDRLPAYAERYADAGFAVLLFDYRGFGDSGGGPRQVIDIRRQQEDYEAAIVAARGLDGHRPRPDRAVRLLVQRRPRRQRRGEAPGDRRGDRPGPVRRRHRAAQDHADQGRAALDGRRDPRPDRRLARPCAGDDPAGRRAGHLRGDDRARGQARLRGDRRPTTRAGSTPSARA